MDPINQVFKPFLKYQDFEEEQISSAEQKLRLGIAYLLSSNNNEAEKVLATCQKSDGESHDILLMSRLLIGYNMLKEGRNFEATMHFNAFVETTLKKDRQPYRLFRDLCLTITGKSIKNLYDDWGVYSKKRWDLSKNPVTGNTSVKDKDVNAEYPCWPTLDSVFKK